MKVNKLLAGGALLCLVLSAGACDRTEKAMPLTRDNLMAYRNKLVESRDRITMKDREEAQKTVDGSKRLFARTFIEPMNELGFSYDRTVEAFAEKVEKGNLKYADPETRAQVEGFVMMAKETCNFALKNGFITGDTKKALDRIGVK